jgi:serine/threonine-protein kinase RsbW
LKINKLYSTTITSDISNIGSVVKDVLSSVNGLCHSNEEAFMYDLKVILNELILNAIKHGNKEDSSKSIKISVALMETKYLLLQVEDEGGGYDYSCNNTVEIDCTDIDSLLESGRGMTIVKCLCDKVKLNKKGNKILILKKLSF